MSTVGRWVSSVRDAFSALSGFGPRRVSARDDEPLQPLNPRALVIVYDPAVDSAGGVKLSKHLDWSKVDDLVAGYIADIAECSGGLVQYRVVERVDVDEFPLKADILCGRNMYPRPGTARKLNSVSCRRNITGSVILWFGNSPGLANCCRRTGSHEV